MFSTDHQAPCFLRPGMERSTKFFGESLLRNARAQFYIRYVQYRLCVDNIKGSGRPLHNKAEIRRCITGNKVSNLDM
jgi:hypothetical protein